MIPGAYWQLRHRLIVEALLESYPTLVSGDHLAREFARRWNLSPTSRPVPSSASRSGALRALVHEGVVQAYGPPHAREYALDARAAHGYELARVPDLLVRYPS